MGTAFQCPHPSFLHSRDLCRVVSGQKPRTSLVLQGVMGARLWLGSDPGLRNRKALECWKSIPSNHIPREPRSATKLLNISLNQCALSESVASCQFYFKAKQGLENQRPHGFWDPCPESEGPLYTCSWGAGDWKRATGKELPTSSDGNSHSASQ